MYFSATMTIDPSKLSQLRRRPTKGFRRFAEIMTGNLLSKQEEHETFTALSIMQEINIVLRSIGVADVVKFSKDDQTLYDDSTSSSSDDIGIAMDSLSREANYSQHSFHKLSLLLEHHLETLALIIEIRILKVHSVGVFPIQIAINGLDADMQSNGGRDTLSERLDQVFASQQSYDDYVESKKAEFDGFVKRMEEAFRGRMRIENLHSRVYANIVRPALKPSGDRRNNSNAPNSAEDASSPPIMQRYDSGSDSMMYLWLWSSMMHSNNTHCRNSTIVTEGGQPVFSVGDEGFSAGIGSTMDPDAPFEPPMCLIEPVEGVAGEVANNTDFGLFDGNTGVQQDSSWFDSFAFGGDASGTDSSGTGSDGGGASCGGGGGCGGGCGS